MTFPTTNDTCGIETCRGHQVVACHGIPPCDELRCPFRARCSVDVFPRALPRALLRWPFGPKNMEVTDSFTLRVLWAGCGALGRPLPIPRIANPRVLTHSVGPATQRDHRAKRGPNIGPSRQRTHGLYPASAPTHARCTEHTAPRAILRPEGATQLSPGQRPGKMSTPNIQP